MMPLRQPYVKNLVATGGSVPGDIMAQCPISQPARDYPTNGEPPHVVDRRVALINEFQPFVQAVDTPRKRRILLF